MRALRFDGQLRFVTDAPRPRREGESLVRVLLAGICRTDIEITRGYAGFRGILGHEFVGVVEASSNPQLIGRRVVGEINVGCGHCAWCRRSDPRHCPSRTTLGIRGRDGAFAEFLSLPAENLFPIPETLADEVAVFTEPLAAAAEILEQITIEPEDQVVILGDGKLGLLIAQVVRLTGCQPTLIGKHKHKLAIARRRDLHTLSLDEASRLPPQHTDCVIEATGSPTGLELALRLVRPRGRIVLKSTYHGQQMLDLTPLVVDEITMLGSRCGRFPRALELLTTGQVEVVDLVSDIWPLEAGVQAFSEAQRPGALKVLLRP